VAKPPNDAYTALFSNVGAQGKALDAPLSKSDQYYAYLSKVEQNASTELYDVLFEVIPYEWAENALFARTQDVPIMAPTSPASLYHITAVDQGTILGALGLRSADYLAEGSWYLLTLVKGEDGKSVTGDLYDPDIDKLSSREPG
jgi:hypothetical protein